MMDRISSLNKRLNDMAEHQKKQDEAITEKGVVNV